MMFTKILYVKLLINTKNKIYENSDIPVYKLNQLLSEMLIKGIIAEVGGRLCDNRN